MKGVIRVMGNEKELDKIFDTDKEVTKDTSVEHVSSFDVLDILGDVDVEDVKEKDKETDSVQEKIEGSGSVSSKGREDSSEKIKALREAIRESDLFGGEGNMGSGDIIEDMIGWLQNTDKIPSDPLNSFIANSDVKLERSMDFNILMALSKRASNLLEFITESEKMLFDPNDLLSLETDDLKERHAAASKSFDNMMELTRKMLHSLKKEKRDAEVDKLKMLLSSLPSEKLIDLIRALK